MIHEQCTRSVALTLLTAMVGCTPKPSSGTTQPQPEPVAALPQGPVASGPNTPPPTAPAEHARSIAQQWCEAGGDQFGPPGGDPDGYPPPLEACEDIATDVLHSRTLGSISAAILEVDAGFETREILLVQDGTTDHTIELFHEHEDESGEGGVYTRTYDSVELRDVYGDATPEWIATTTTSGGDSFEADRCYANDTTVVALLVCTLELGALHCFEVNTTGYEYDRPREADQLYDCEVPPRPDDITRSGYVLSVEIETGTAVFTPSAEPPMDEAEGPPYQGRVPLKTLFEEQPLAP